MKGKQWYIYLLDKYVLKSDLDDNIQQNILCKAETEKPNVNWETSWQLARLGGLGSPSITFLWRMLHNILPTKQRLNRVTRTVNSPLCTKCDLNMEDDLEHALLKCPYNRDVSEWMLKGLQWECTFPAEHNILSLDVELSHTENGGLPFIWFLAETLQLIFICRKEGKPCNLFNIRAKLEAKVNILRRSRYNGICNTIQLMMNC